MATLVVNVHEEKCDVYIGRPSIWGNPFVVRRDGTLNECIEKHRKWIYKEIEAPDGRQPPSISKIKAMLTGKRLGCFCAPGKCHGDNYVRICDGD